jgi:DNA-binding NarL/FixJ family response regulator
VTYSRMGGGELQRLLQSVLGARHLRIGRPLMLVAAVDDLFFSARIKETARQVGAPIEIVTPAKLKGILEERLAEGTVDSVILDLNAAGAVGVIQALKAGQRTRKVPIIGFASHVAKDLIAAARDAGCDQVLARSAFTTRLPELLASPVHSMNALKGSL